METIVNSNIWSAVVALISVIGSVGLTWLTLVYRRRRSKTAPKDRIETIFDGYDALIAQLRSDIDSKTTLIGNLQKLVDSQAEDIARSQALIKQLQQQLTDSAANTERLQAQLANLKAVI
jgi:peptidoglycan hydrolase CwlO-like protein